MIQEARPWLVDFHAAAAFDCFPVFWVLLLALFLGVSASWDLSLSPWVVLAFLRLELFIFLLGLFQVFRNFNVRVWGLFCVIGLGSLVPAFFFSCPTDPPRSVLGPGWSLLFVCLPFFSPSCRPPPLSAWPGSG